MKQYIRLGEYATMIDRLTKLFQAIGEENRMRIINLLLDTEELCVCDIERVLDIPQPRVSRHLNYLKQAGIVSARRNGQWMHYRLVRDSEFHDSLYKELKDVFATIPRLKRDIRSLHTANCLVCQVVLR